MLCTVIGLTGTQTTQAADQSDSQRAQGRYLVEIAGCNDCHTPGYAPSGGKVPESQWLIGDQLGFRGPWGTTYPINLRTYIGSLSEDEWVAKAKSLQARPPMPSWALNAMKETDLRALYAFVKSLGPSDNKVPAYVPPNEQPMPPVIQWPSPEGQ